MDVIDFVFLFNLYKIFFYSKLFDRKRVLWGKFFLKRDCFFFFSGYYICSYFNLKCDMEIFFCIIKL